MRCRVFTAKRPGINPDVPSGYAALAWVPNWAAGGLAAGPLARTLRRPLAART